MHTKHMHTTHMHTPIRMRIQCSQSCYHEVPSQY